MPIENRNLTKGTKLTGRYHKQTYSCEVVERCGRETALPSGGWTGIQEPFSCRNGHHRTFLRRLGILECANGRECSCTESGESRSCSCGGDQSGNCRACSDCCQDRPQENRRVSGAESERVCRKVKFAGSAGTAARASLPRQSKYRGFAPTIKSAKTT